MSSLSQTDRQFESPTRSFQTGCLMSNPETGRISWRRVLIEAVAIIASILIAFSLDAWWDTRSERTPERALLTALAEDFEAAAASFNATKASHLAELQASEEIIGYGESGEIPLADHARIDTLISRQFSRRMFDPPMGTVQSILGSGRIDLISNPELVTELTRWLTAVAALQRSEEDSRDHFYDHVFPYLSSRLDLEDLDKGFPSFVDFPWPQEWAVFRWNARLARTGLCVRFRTGACRLTMSSGPAASRTFAGLRAFVI